MSDQAAEGRQIAFNNDTTLHKAIMFVNDAAAQLASPSCPTSAGTSPRCSATAPPDPWDLTDKGLLSPGKILGPLRRSSSVNIPLIKQASAVPEILRDDYVGYIRDSGPTDLALKRYLLI